MTDFPFVVKFGEMKTQNISYKKAVISRIEDI